jgi:hypothetical protein
MMKENVYFFGFSSRCYYLFHFMITKNDFVEYRKSAKIIWFG